ncbi:MAG: hypothetical protein CVU42_07330 [Chloroflexi bacterium HGW-Chloroflexi-4]|nr:MAG: hypothetical protein CVU42_07330 [Chloroflexi bacterium HGW-Chloroflexi-4]
MFITFSSIVLVVYSLSHITKLKLSEDHVRKLADQSQFDTENTNEVFNGVKRDIYYIILDAYTRDDHLLSEFQFDNSEFLSELEDLGFYIARCSQPNYPSTALAMASTLNFEYLDSLAPDIINNNYSWVNFKPYIDNNRTTQFFQNLGYTYITAQTSFDWINNPNSDIYLRRYTIGGAIIELTAFETMFLNSTIFRSVKGIDFLPNIKNVATYEESHYETILSTLDKMDKIIAISGPKFSYIHIAVPHRPYIFTPEGDFFITEDPSVGYINNIQFINNQIIPVLKDLISKSEPAPIIIVQGDHGHGSSSNFILNAYYLPNGMDTTLYSTISPVNTFRLLMDNYFGTSLGLLDDISYTWKYGDVYKFGIAADDCHR